MTTFVIVTIIVALIFDLVNGFHDAANSIATVVSTRVLSPRYAVLWAAFFNFIAMFIFAPLVANTISKIVKIQPDQLIYTHIVFAGLAGAIVWSLITWWLGLPTSSSHALIGGVSGAGVMHGGWNALEWGMLNLTLIFIVLAPLIGFCLGFLMMLLVSWIFRRSRPHSVDRWFRRGQLVSASLYSIGHGANDAQKTMGIIVALLVAAGHFSPNTQLSLYSLDTAWIIFACHLAMAIGTAFGGWRIVKTMGMKITKLKPVGGFCAEAAGACTLFFATIFGIPVSTTHTINGSIIGVGTCTTKFSSVRWGVATNIFWAWIFTIPAAASISALVFLLMT
jgi:PiT family inorganic phosphate transporter